MHKLVCVGATIGGTEGMHSLVRVVPRLAAVVCPRNICADTAVTTLNTCQAWMQCILQNVGSVVRLGMLHNYRVCPVVSLVGHNISPARTCTYRMHVNGHALTQVMLDCVVKHAQWYSTVLQYYADGQRLIFADTNL